MGRPRGSKNKKTVKRKGLGDKIEELTEKTGIKAVVELLNGGKCKACEKRKVYLNKLFPEVVYNLEKGKATPEQKAILKKIGLNKDKYEADEADILEAIYNQTFHTNIRFCRHCSSPKNNLAIIARLRKLI